MTEFFRDVPCLLSTLEALEPLQEAVFVLALGGEEDISSG